MNLKKINAAAVKTVKPVNPTQSLSIEAMKKVMGGGSYGAHCCVPKTHKENVPIEALIY